jgi:hypothetical protein
MTKKEAKEILSTYKTCLQVKSDGRRRRVLYKNTGKSTKQYYHARVVWSSVNGAIPDGHHIHHIDCDPLNDNITNLQCVTQSDHIRAHKRESFVRGVLEFLEGEHEVV